MSAHIRIARDDAVLRLTMARPEKKNALTGDMYDALREALEAADTGGEVAAIVFEGAGGAFTAGNDIGDFLQYSGDFSQSPALRFVRALAACQTPMVAAVDGVAVGVGTTMLLHCDFVYAAPSARFRMPFIDLGVVPEAAASLLLPRRVGMARASELLMLGQGFDAKTALDMGLLNAIVEPAELSRAALDTARALASKPRAALRETRRLLRGDSADILARIDEEALLFAQALRSPETKAALNAFLARPKGG